ncbi:MAG: hypothetical protein N2544_18080, partial [Burkholderiales bacterium]|nr:hypothetical protein [Burkholderiales bacterium]
QVLTYLYRTTAGTILYNNLAPEVQHPGTPCGAFYVYYLDIYGCPQYALLNNEPAYQLLTVDVYDEWDTTQRYYRLQDLGHQFLVEVLFDHKRLHPDFRMFVVRLLPRDFGEITFPTAASSAACHSGSPAAAGAGIGPGARARA